MESLSEATWDVVISGTGLPQALLALSLSRSGKKILHVDRHRYYGAEDAAFTLQEAEQWVKDVAAGQEPLIVEARLAHSPETTSPSASLASRAYSLSLAPQILYARSKVLQTLVSSQVHTQLEFLAIGSWWTWANGNLKKVPGSREDVFADEALSMREKRALMKLLRYVMHEWESEDTEHEAHETETLQTVLSSRFGIPPHLQTPLLALSLSSKSSDSTDFEFALARIKRHMQGIGFFGAGFPAVIPKYGANAEIAQVACRACAVGGGIYVLGQGIKSISTIPLENRDGEAEPASSRLLDVELAGGEKVKAAYVVGSTEGLPESSFADESSASLTEFMHSVSVVSEPLDHLFPATSENGPPSAVAIVLVNDAPGGSDDRGDHTPIYLQVHSEETGECPRGQCIIYGSMLHEESSRQRLSSAVEKILATSSADNPPSLLWSMSYISRRRTSGSRLGDLSQNLDGNVIAFPTGTGDLAFDDSVLDSVEAAWKRVLGDESGDEEFMRFTERPMQVEDE